MSDFVKCVVCGAGMTREHAADHIAKHREAGDLVRRASQRERAELREEL